MYMSGSSSVLELRVETCKSASPERGSGNCAAPVIDLSLNFDWVRQEPEITMGDEMLRPMKKLFTSLSFSRMS